MLRNKLIVVLLVAVSFNLSANGQADNSSADSEEITKLVFWDENGGANRTPYHREILARFMEKNPDIVVEYVGIPMSSSKEKYDVAIMSNSTPDVGGNLTRWISSFTVKEALLPLDEYFSTWEDKDNFPQIYIDHIAAQSLDNRLYMLPTSANTNTFWYRKDRYQEIGTSAPTTWDAFFDVIKKTTTDEYKGFSIRGGAGSIHQFLPALYGYSGITDFFDEDGKCTLNDPKNVEFTERFIALYKTYTPESDITNGYKEMVAAFGSGSANMIFHNLGSYDSHLENIGTGFSAFSVPPSQYTQVCNLETPTLLGYSMFKGTENEEAAWRLLAHYASVEEQSYFCENMGVIPTNSSLLNADWLQNMDHLHENMSALSAEGTTTWSTPTYLPDCSAIMNNSMVPMFQEMMMGSITAQEFLDNSAELFEASKKEWDTFQN